MSNIIKTNKPENYVRFIKLKRFYNENKRKYRTETLGEFARMISKMGDYSIFELLMINSPVKIYVDIENIPRSAENTVYDIIGDLKTFIAKTANVEIGKYVLTYNPASRHEGLSYHLIFTEYYVKNLKEIKGLLTQFLNEYRQYSDFIDVSVYTNKRLFRSINQKGIRNSSDEPEATDDDYHRIISENGKVEDTIIQNIIGCKLFDHHYGVVKNVGARTSEDRFNKPTGTQNCQQPVVVKIYNTPEGYQVPLSRNEANKSDDINDVDNIIGKLKALQLTSQNDKVVQWCSKELELYNLTKDFDMTIPQMKSVLNNLN